MHTIDYVDQIESCNMHKIDYAVRVFYPRAGACMMNGSLKLISQLSLGFIHVQVIITILVP